MTLPPEKRKDLEKRLSRIEGQVRGIQNMIANDRYCGDVLAQIASIQKALDAVGNIVTRNHLETCVTNALRSGDVKAAEKTYNEIMDLLTKK